MCAHNKCVNSNGAKGLTFKIETMVRVGCRAGRQSVLRGHEGSKAGLGNGQAFPMPGCPQIGWTLAYSQQQRFPGNWWVVELIRVVCVMIILIIKT